MPIAQCFHMSGIMLTPPPRTKRQAETRTTTPCFRLEAPGVAEMKGRTDMDRMTQVLQASTHCPIGSPRVFRLAPVHSNPADAPMHAMCLSEG